MQNNNQIGLEFPQILCIKPTPLIGFSGLDVVNNAIHKNIWDAFSSNRRSERAPILFKLIENHHEFPVIKPKRNSYDWYIPKGILKKNWMNKHLYEIPAVMVIFYDLDWSDVQWREKMIECASRVRSMRAALEGRNTSIIVVLIQNAPPHPASEDVLASEGAISLCTSCEISAQSLFVLPHGEHLYGYTLRLEDAFFELAKIYYINEAKIVRSHKEQLNKNIHQYLFIRHQFKIAYFHELKQDVQTALKHYMHAYNNLLEVRIVDTNALEIRTIAGFINYKICRILFAINLPRDAINQFKPHIDRFKTRSGFQELSFEHYAWLSKQYSLFGDLFDEAVKLGLPAVQTQHPGIYYQQAAQYGILRKKSCQELCSKIIAYPFPDPLENASHMEFYGQRPWRPGKMTAEPPDPHLEQSGIEALQYLEKQVNHSNLIITLFGQAITQYKAYRCPRTRRYLVLQMADEYYESKDYGKALTLYTHMLWDFRSEKWWGILSKILEKAIACAFLTANVQDYLSLAIELLGSYTEVSLDDKRRIYENLVRILKKQIPFGDPKLPQDLLQNAIFIWQPVISGDPTIVSLDMSNIPCCVSTKARFTKNKYEVYQKVTVEVFVRCNCPFPLSFTKVSTTINTSSYSSEFAVSLQNGTLSFHKDEVKRFMIEFMVDPSDINKEIGIGSINLLLGDPSGCALDLKFSPANDSNVENHAELIHFKYNASDKLDFDNIQPLSTASIVPRESKLNVIFDHQHPALVGEWYQINVKVTNEEAFDISDLQLKVNVLDCEEAASVQLSSDLHNPQVHTTTLSVHDEDTPTLETETTTTISFYIKSLRPNQINMQMQITYTLKSAKPLFSIKCENLSLTVVEPYTFNTKFLSMLMENIDKFFMNEEFGVLNQIHFTSPWPIVVEETTFEFVNPILSSEETHSKVLTGKAFSDGEVATELFTVICEKPSEKNVNIGEYQIKWKRQNGVSTTTTQFSVQGLPCESIPIGLKVTVPPHGFVRTPMVLSYHLINKCQELLNLDVVMEGSEAFMFSGYKQSKVCVLPNSIRTIEYIMYPLLTGSVPLPRLVLSDSGANNTEEKAFVLDQLQLNCLTRRILPSHIYVMPQMKGNAKLPDLVTPRRITKTY